MDPMKRLARRAGLLYWLACLPAPFAFLYLPRVLMAPGDAAATADRVRASAGLLRAGVVAELAGATVLVFAALALYRLFENVERRTARLMAATMLISVPISYLNALNNVAPLVLVESPAFATALDPGPLAAQVMLFLRLHGFGLVFNQIFWGLWLFPFGVLFLRSELGPRWLAYPMFAAGIGYVISSLVVLLLPPSLRWIAQSAQLLGIGELPIAVWLIIWGARPPRGVPDSVRESPR